MTENLLDFKKEYTLTPQSPLIHFQYGQKGATLRATEVKPKFDKFLISKAKKNHFDLSGCFIGDTNALNYIDITEIPGETARMAMMFVVAGPALVIFPFFQKYFVKGMTVGSVKG